MIRKAFCIAVSIVIMLTLFSGCSQSEQKKEEPNPSQAEVKDSKPEPKPDDKQIVLRFSDNQPEDYPSTKGAYEFARIVGEKTNGRIKIEVYPSAQLGEEKAVNEQLQFGAIDFARASSAPLAEFYKELNVLSLPYLYRDPEHMWKVLEGPIGDEFLNGLTSAKLVGLCWYDAGARNFYNTKKEIKSVADLKGLKIRVQESKIMMGLVSALGAVPTPMSYGEVYSGLKTGVIDGAENNWPSYLTSSHWEVAKYYVIDEHTRLPEIIIASKATMDKLSDEDQKIIKEAALESSQYQKKLWADYEKEAEEKIRDGGGIITVLQSNEEFQKSVEPLYDEFGKDYTDIIKRIREVK